MSDDLPYHVLYYTHGPRGRETVWYAAKAPGDGGKDWEYTKDAKKAGVFPWHLLQRWVRERRGKAGWRVIEPYDCKLCGQRITDGKPCGCGAR